MITTIKTNITEPAKSITEPVFKRRCKQVTTGNEKPEIKKPAITAGISRGYIMA